ncbi:MAG: hypothetical protein P9M03_11120 [Candidatus Theseobacter exili]|nr:hypothetical protein [Candidatus Theseobacter exili]
MLSYSPELEINFLYKRTKSCLGLFFLAFFLLFPCFLFVSNAFSQDTQPFNSVIVKYKLQGKNAGSETLYVKGNNVRSITNFITEKGVPIVLIDMLTVDNGQNLYLIDLNQRTGVKLSSKANKSYAEMSSDEIQKYREDNLLGIPEALSALQLGEEKVLGRVCTVYEIPSDKISTKIWVWKNLILKSEIRGAVLFDKVAHDIKINPVISDEVFKIPEEVKVEEKSSN